MEMKFNLGNVDELKDHLPDEGGHKAKIISVHIIDKSPIGYCSIDYELLDDTGEVVGEFFTIIDGKRPQNAIEGLGKLNKIFAAIGIPENDRVTKSTDEIGPKIIGKKLMLVIGHAMKDGVPSVKIKNYRMI